MPSRGAPSAAPPPPPPMTTMTTTTTTTTGGLLQPFAAGDQQQKNDKKTKKKHASASSNVQNLSEFDLKLSAKRRFFDKPIAEPCYEMSRTPSAKPDLKGSFLVRVTDRDVWMAHLTEMLLLCNEAAWRRAERDRDKHGTTAAAVAAEMMQQQQASSSKKKNGTTKAGAAAAAAAAAAAESSQKQALSYLPPIVPHEPKPLLLEYLADRLDTDDPLQGYVVRHNSAAPPRPGCPAPSPPAYPLQGFVLFTNFTTWAPHFHFVDDLANEPLAGVTKDDFASHRVDYTGDLARALDSHPKRGDPEEEGMILSRVAEVSLLGGLGCGATMLRFVLDELAASGEYDHVVLQATDQAVPFYESMGFVRIGCVACSDNEITGVSLDGCPYKVLNEAHAPALAAADAARAVADSEGGISGSCLASLRSACSARPHSKEPTFAEATEHARRLYWVHKVMRTCLRYLRKLPGSSLFAYPVSEDEVPGYLSVVAEPMAYYDVQRRVSLGYHQGGYRSWAQFKRDIMLIAENCTFFNRLKTSEYHKLGVELRRQARALFASWEKRCGDWLTHDDPLARNNNNNNVINASLVNGDVAMAPAGASDSDAAAAAAAPNLKRKGGKLSAKKGKKRGRVGGSKSGGSTGDMAAAAAAAAAAMPPSTEPDPHDPNLLAAYNASARVDPCVLGYVHWTFHDQPVEDQYPSYMMARSVHGPLEYAPTCPSVPPQACVTVPRGNGKFAAKVVRGGAHSYLGIFESEKEAMARYREAAKEYDKAHTGLAEAPTVGKRRSEPPAMFEQRERLLSLRPPGFELPPPEEEEEKEEKEEKKKRKDEMAVDEQSHRGVASADASKDPGTSGPSSPTLRSGRSVPLTVAPVASSLGTKARNLIQTTLPFALLRASTRTTRASEGAAAAAAAAATATTAAASGSAKAKEKQKEEPAPLAAPAIVPATTTAAAAVPPPPPPSSSAAEPPPLSPMDANALALARASCPDPPEPPKKGTPKLYNKTVKVKHLDPETYPHTYWFVYQYVPDMRWAHLCPMVISGYFAGNSTSKRYGRPRYKLAPEGTVRELDVAAHRVQVVKSEQVAKNTDADQEVWDVFDDDEIPPQMAPGWVPPSEPAATAAATATAAAAAAAGVV